jgi:hypothetical protein
MNWRHKIVCIFGFVPLLSYGQYNSDGESVSRFRSGIMWYNTGWKPAKPEKLRKYDRLMFDISYNDWVGDRKTFKMRGPSLGMNVSWLFEIPLVKKNIVSFALGPGYGFFNLRHDLPSEYSPENQTYTLGSYSEIGLYGKRKIIGHQLTIPFEFRFRTKGWRHFKVHIGGKIGYQISLYEKNRLTTTDESGNTLSNVEKNKFPQEISRFVYSVHARIGIRNFALFGSYNFNPLFKNSESTQLHLLQLGLTISLF